ncbi:GTPase IMAP family member 8, partial [Nibea albiflora]
TFFLSELNVMLVGSNTSNKYLVGNIILGKDLFDVGDVTPGCQRRQGEVCGRKVTLAKAPGWPPGYELCNTPELFKTEAILSVTPGLHGFILVVDAELPFKKVNKKATKEHLQYFFGDRVWEHTIVVFTHSSHLSYTIEDYIKREGAPLQWLLKTCGNRYHVLCDDGTDNNKKVEEMFEKIDAMVAENSCYEIDIVQMQNAESKRKEVDKKAEELRMQTRQQRQNLRRLVTGNLGLFYYTNVWPTLDLIILMVGWVFSGKSAAGSKILSTKEFQSGERTVKALKQSGDVAGRQVVIVDTPGWWKFFPAKFNPSLLKSEILKGVSLCSPSPNVILLAVTLDTSFTEEQRRVTEDNMKLLGPRVWRHVIVLFTFGDSLGDKTIEQHIESEGRPLRWLIEKCGNRYHVINNMSAADDQVTELLEKMEEMVAGNSYLYLKLNVMLVGSTTSNKYLVGNIILGKDLFDVGDVTPGCQSRQGEVCGRKVTLAKAPGWLPGYELCNTPELFKTEAILSVTPGLHGFILVVNTELPFKKVNKKATKEHLQYFFGDRVWDHTIVVFTHRSHLSYTIEDYIKREGAPLQWLLKACGNRYHVLCDDGTDNNKKVKELFQNIDAMVAENSCYEIDIVLMQNAESKRKEVDKKAEELRMQAQQQRQNLRRLVTGPPLDMRILMVGWVFSGKSAAGNNILSTKEFQFGERTVKTLKQSVGDSLGDKTIEQHIESEGRPLRWLIEKCGNRYHVINNKSAADDQVTELLEKMEEMVAGNSSFYLSTYTDADDPQHWEDRSDTSTENKDENTAKEIIEQLNIEWDLSDEGQESDRSEGEEEETEHPHEDDQFKSCFGLQEETLNRWKRLLESEWSRREYAMLQSYLYSPFWAVMSEPDSDRLQKSREKVSKWLKTQHATSGYATASNTSYTSKEEENGGHGRVRQFPMTQRAGGAPKRRKKELS